MTLYICGDSTAAAYASERAPLTGWGQVLPDMLPGVEIANHAIAGRSTKSFLREGRLAAIEERLLPGDLLLIQFTHNDASDREERHTDPHTTFPENLSVFVGTARRHGAVPVLLTPIPRLWWREGALADAHGEYPPAIRRLAAQENVPVIDVLDEGMKALSALGEEASRRLYMNLEPGAYPAWPDGSEDDAHTCRAGAELFACITCQGLRRLGLI